MKDTTRRSPLGGPGSKKERLLGMGGIVAILMTVFSGSLPVRAEASAQASGKTVTRVSLIAGGDVMFGRLIAGRLHRRGYHGPFQWIRSLLSGHDLVMCNLETPITSATLYARKGSRLVFRAEPEAVGILRQAGFNLIVTANNHAQDQRGAGIVETIGHLRAGGLRWVGTGRSREEAWRPYIFKKGDLSVGILAVTRLVNYSMRQKDGFVAHLTRQRVRKDLPPLVAALRRRVDFVVVSLHWGTEYFHDVIGRERLLIRKLARAGASVFIGHHPHVLRGIQYRDGLVAFYSLGNLSFDAPRGDRGESGLAHVVFTKSSDGTKTLRAEFIPLRLDRRGFPHPPSQADRAFLLRRMMRYSRSFRSTTRFEVHDGRLQVRPVQGRGLR